MIPMAVLAHGAASLIIVALMEGADLDAVYLTVAAFNAALVLFEALTMKGV